MCGPFTSSKHIKTSSRLPWRSTEWTITPSRARSLPEVQRSVVLWIQEREFWSYSLPVAFRSRIGVLSRSVWCGNLKEAKVRQANLDIPGGPYCMWLLTDKFHAAGLSIRSSVLLFISFFTEVYWHDGTISYIQSLSDRSVRKCIINNNTLSRGNHIVYTFLTHHPM